MPTHPKDCELVIKQVNLREGTTFKSMYQMAASQIMVPQMDGVPSHAELKEFQRASNG
jgi:hypothetical protein